MGTRAQISTQDVGPAVSELLMKKISWRLVPLMILMYLVASLDRANIGYAALTMNRELGMTTADFGTAAGLFYLGFIVFQVPAGLALHRFGARRWVAFILLAWGVMATLTAFVPNAHWLYVLRFFLGVFEAGLFPGMVYYLTLWLPSRNRVWIMSLFVTSMPLALVVGAPISTALMQNVALFSMSGWRSMIFLEGVPAVLLGVIVYFSLPDSPRRAAWMSESELSELENAIAVEKGGTKTESSSGTTVWSTMANAKLWALGVVYFGLNAGIVVLLFFLPQVIKTFEGIFGRKYSVTDIGMISAVPFSFAVLFLIFWGRYMTKRRLTAIHVAGPLGLAAASIGVALLLHSPFQVMTAFAIGTAGCFVTLTTFWQLPSRFLDGRSAAAGIGLISGLGLVSAVVLPYFIGWMKDKTGSFTSAFLCVAGFMALGALVVVIMEARLKKGSSV